jgi:hypothetical protein
VGHVGGKTIRFLIVVFRICHSEKRCGYAVIEGILSAAEGGRA